MPLLKALTTGASPMTITEIIALARRMVRECRNGLARACRYLQSLRLPPEFACWALRGV